MEIKGVLKQIHQTVTNNNLESRKVWLTLDPQGQYPQTIEVEAQQKNLNLFNNITPGTWVTCHINVRGREWTKDGVTKVFNTLSVWKVEVAGKAVGEYQAPAPVKQDNKLPASFDASEESPF